MRGAFICFLMVGLVHGQSFNAESDFQLAPPQIWVSSQLFTDSVQVKMQFRYPDAQIRYRTDGAEVTTTDSIYKGPFTLTQSSQITAKAFHPELRSSKHVSVSLERIKYNIKNSQVFLSEMPKAPYQGSGPLCLTDLKRGTTSFRGNTAWMGFQTDSLGLILRLKSAVELKEVKVGFLQDQGSWIFGPSHITVYHKEKVIGAACYKDAASPQTKEVALCSVPITKGRYTELSIHIHPLAKIPDWHDGAGTTPWLFLDEILIN